jgi:hypothetical protein
MRALLAIAFLSSSAMADPAPGPSPSPVRGPESGVAAPVPSPDRWQAYQPADQGGFSGIVVVPKPMQDALPYPRGMVITPPDTGDRMGNALTSPWAWASRSLWQRFGEGIDAIWSVLQPQNL